MDGKEILKQREFILKCEIAAMEEKEKELKENNVSIEKIHNHIWKILKIQEELLEVMEKLYY